MELSGNHTIAAPPEEVWEHMHTPRTLMACIPGCTKFERESATRFHVTVSRRVVFVNMKFNGTIDIENPKAPESCRLIGTGEGGVFGFAKGISDIKLVAQPGGTQMQFTIHTELGGRLAEMGQRLIGKAASGVIERFFERFEAAIIAARTST